MGEIVFPCKCSMILKVYGDDQIGQGIICPSCGSTVIVPAVSVAVAAPRPLVSDGPDAPRTASNMGRWFGLAYLAGIGVVTLGLIKFILMPALAPPDTRARVDATHEEAPDKTTKTTESDDAPRRLLKQPRDRAPKESDNPEVEAPKLATLPKSGASSAKRRPAPRKNTPKKRPGDGVVPPTAAIEIPVQNPPQRLESGAPAPFARWTFEIDARDQVGSLHGKLLHGAQVRGGRLYLDGKGSYLRTEALPHEIRAKTLEAWVALANLGQRGGAVVSLERGRTFDAIVFGEIERGKWIAGSDFFHRTRNLVAPAELARPTDLIHLAITYDARQGITVYRDGRPYGQRYFPPGRQPSVQTYPAGESYILLGLRTTDAKNGLLAGAIEEARLYDRALTADEVFASYRAGVFGATSGEQAAETVDGGKGLGREPARPTAVNSIGMTLVLIPPGEFGMGANVTDIHADFNERPHHRVRLTRAFALGTTEVTQGEYKAVMEGKNPSHLRGNDSLPVENLSWLEAVAFCNALSRKEGLSEFYRIDETNAAVRNWDGAGYRLPTEAEWEYACRAGSATLYWFGDNPDEVKNHAWLGRDQNNRPSGGNSGDQPHPVRAPGHDNPFGLFDMHGNVAEWCWDQEVLGEYEHATSPLIDPTGPSKSNGTRPARRFRGGSFRDSPLKLRSSARDRSLQDSGQRYLGFRIARNRPPG